MASTSEISLSLEKAFELCKQYRERQKVKLLSRCWACVRFSKGNPKKMWFYDPPNNGGCRFVLYKSNPILSYLRPLLEKPFKILIQAGCLRMVDGGASEGQYLITHPLIDEIHLTGSNSTYEAVTSSLKRRKNNTITTEQEKKITAELGGVGPFIIVPGPWNDSDLHYHAEHLVSTIVANAGYNCSTPRIIIQSKNWNKRQQFLEDVRLLFGNVPPRKDYYPGSKERYNSFIEEHKNAEKSDLSKKTPFHGP